MQNPVPQSPANGKKKNGNGNGHSRSRMPLAVLAIATLLLAAGLVWQANRLQVRAREDEIEALGAQINIANEQLTEIRRVDTLRQRDTVRRRLVGIQRPDGETVSSAIIQEMSRLLPHRAVINALYMVKVENEWVAIVAGTGKNIDATTTQATFSEFYYAALKSPMFNAVEFDPMRLKPLKPELMLRRFNKTIRLPADFLNAAARPGQITYLLKFYLRPSQELNLANAAGAAAAH